MEKVKVTFEQDGKVIECNLDYDSVEETLGFELDFVDGQESDHADTLNLSLFGAFIATITSQGD